MQENSKIYLNNILEGMAKCSLKLTLCNKIWFVLQKKTGKSFGISILKPTFASTKEFNTLNNLPLWTSTNLWLL
jgi:hypothetical protein